MPMQNDLLVVQTISHPPASHPMALLLGLLHAQLLPQEVLSYLLMSLRPAATTSILVHLYVWPMQRGMIFARRCFTIHRPKSSTSHWQWCQFLCNTLPEGVPEESHRIWGWALWCQRLRYLLVSTYVRKAQKVRRDFWAPCRWWWEVSPSVTRHHSESSFERTTAALTSHQCTCMYGTLPRTCT